MIMEDFIVFAVEMLMFYFIARIAARHEIRFQREIKNDKETL